MLQVLAKLLFIMEVNGEKNADFNHSKGIQLRVVKVGTRIKTARKQASKK